MLIDTTRCKYPNLQRHATLQHPILEPSAGIPRALTTVFSRSRRKKLHAHNQWITKRRNQNKSEEISKWRG